VGQKPTSPPLHDALCLIAHIFKHSTNLHDFWHTSLPFCSVYSNVIKVITQRGGGATWQEFATSILLSMTATGISA